MQFPMALEIMLRGSSAEDGMQACKIWLLQLLIGHRLARAEIGLFFFFLTICIKKGGAVRMCCSAIVCGCSAILLKHGSKQCDWRVSWAISVICQASLTPAASFPSMPKTPATSPSDSAEDRPCSKHPMRKKNSDASTKVIHKAGDVPGRHISVCRAGVTCQRSGLAWRERQKVTAARSTRQT